MKKLLLLLLLFPLLSFNSAHKFYVSVTDMVYNDESQSLQIISRVFIDDMEKLLKARYSDELYLDKNDEHPAADGFLQKYYEDKLQVSIKGELKQVNYIGKKYENDQLVLFLEVEKLASPPEVTVKNEVLTDLFPEQKNVVHVTRNDITRSLILTRNNKSGRIKFGN
ncbi:DUF6702 family protein [Salinimicrobium sp. GXAS 041]|uniref:DUF6702 family protein n=1 Tax=Salinimicrobium sp. GXAS 041 TaxID=3400806 RepID=UPI003C748EF2